MLWEFFRIRGRKWMGGWMNITSKMFANKYNIIKYFMVVPYHSVHISSSWQFNVFSALKL